MRTEFTPGPWCIDSSGSIVTANNRGYVAEAYDGLPGVETDPYISAANATLIAAAPDLYGALNELEPIFPRPNESSLARFERLAAWFYRETGLLAPGKDAPAAGGQPDRAERSERYDAWLEAKVAAARAALSRASGTGSPQEAASLSTDTGEKAS